MSIALTDNKYSSILPLKHAFTSLDVTFLSNIIANVLSATKYTILHHSTHFRIFNHLHYHLK